MAKISWGTYKPRSTQFAKKLSLEKDETARICFLEAEPTVVFVHNFEKVKTGPDGRAVIKQDQWPDGTPREAYSTEYAGKLRCLGDDEVLMETGADPENCPACKAAIEEPNAVERPRRRILGHVFKYQTKPNTSTVATPFSGQVLVWDLTEKRFDTLFSIQQENGNLSEIDLILGPCDNKQMQKFDIRPGNGTAKWKESENSIAFLKEAYESGKTDDLEDAAAKKASEAEMAAKVSEIVRAFRHATGAGTSYESLMGGNEDDSDHDGEELTHHVVEESHVDGEEEETTEAPKAKETNSTASLDDLLSSIQF